MPVRLISTVASGALAVSLAVAAVAVAAKPKAGETYSSAQSATTPAVSFRALSAKKLSDLTAGLALKCTTTTCGGFGGIKTFTISSVKVTKKGTFKVSGSILLESGKKLGTETVTGKFVSASEVKGKVTTHATIGDYNGVTESYTAVASMTT